ncbi:unnamed protein product [Enterobius vermicularis]|uniref:Inhibitor of growth protein 3 n=1 Tax=Enterobius vermicularis TaxID=51028 RepID=A0A0N4VAJ3_ENTVE|nr:unnamed protein product [Enterobius vermicularis]
MEKYNQKLHKEIFHFKYELEADNPGITEVIEKRFCDAERALIAQRKDRRKRSHDVSQNSNSPVPSTSSLTKTESPLTTVRSSQKVNTSISATEFSHTEHISNSHSSRSSTSFNDTENPSTSSANRAARPSVGSSDRNPELPPLKVTVKRSSATNKLIAISNFTSSPTLSAPPVTPTALVTATVSSPVPAPKLSVQSTASGTSDSSNDPVAAVIPNPSVLSFAGQESRHGRPRKLTSRVQEMLKDSMQRQERRAPTHQDDGEASDEEESDSDQRVYCWCRQKSFGSMVGCDNNGCPYEWFHYDCVKLTQPPKGKWYCPYCSDAMKTSRSVHVEPT